MKVLHILNELRPSGAEEMLRIAGPFWRSLGCDLHILCIADHPGDFAEQLTGAGWTIHATGPRRGPLHLWRALSKALRDVKPDVLHIHPEGYGPLPPVLGWLHGIPMARTVHTKFGFDGFLAIRKTLERWLARNLGVRFIAIGESVLENERERFHNPCLLLPNWIDTDRFRPPSTRERAAARQRFQLPDEKVVLVSVGNGSDVKNYQSIVEALSVLNDPKLLYCQVGHPHPQGTDKTSATQLGVEDQVRFCGPSNEVLEWLWAADVFVMPSIYEGFGLAAVEALAAGCPCVFADCPGLKDFKSLDIQAKWVAPTPNALASEFREVIDNPPTIDLTTASALTAKEAFASGLRARAYYDLWAALNGSGR